MLDSDHWETQVGGYVVGILAISTVRVIDRLPAWIKFLWEGHSEFRARVIENLKKAKDFNSKKI